MGSLLYLCLDGDGHALGMVSSRSEPRTTLVLPQRWSIYTANAANAFTLQELIPCGGALLPNPVCQQ